MDLFSNKNLVRDIRENNYQLTIELIDNEIKKHKFQDCARLSKFFYSTKVEHHLEIRLK